MDQDTCQLKLVHQDRVDAARQQMPTAERVQQMAMVYKLLGEPSRLSILLALSCAEMCVCDLAAMFTASPSAISHQLKLLRISGLVSARREGKMVYYRLAECAIEQLLQAGHRTTAPQVAEL